MARGRDGARLPAGCPPGSAPPVAGPRRAGGSAASRAKKPRMDCMPASKPGCTASAPRTLHGFRAPAPAMRGAWGPAASVRELDPGPHAPCLRHGPRPTHSRADVLGPCGPSGMHDSRAPPAPRSHQRDSPRWLVGCSNRASSSTMAPQSARCRMHLPMACVGRVQRVALGGQTGSGGARGVEQVGAGCLRRGRRGPRSPRAGAAGCSRRVAGPARQPRPHDNRVRRQTWFSARKACWLYQADPDSSPRARPASLKPRFSSTCLS